ncbi:enoyl-CoA hydratase [Maricaulis sp. CAU 1757]
MSELVLIETSEKIRTIRFNRPEKKNALTQAMYTAAAEALETGNSDPAVRVIILTGADGVFTAGNDLVDFMERPPHVGSDDSPVGRFMQALHNCEKPVIAAVDGLAIGIGVTLLLHCDLAYCSDRAVFKTPFVDLALAPEFGSSQLMPRAFGHVVAAELLMLGASWDGARARETGLVNAVLPAGELDTAARQAALALAAKSPTAVRTAKALMRRAPEPLDDRIAFEGDAFARMLKSPEFAEAAGAFMEKRKPDFDQFD